MSYVPNNVNIYVAAFAGALAGLGASGRSPTDAVAADYSGLTNVAGAFAEAADTSWGDNPANEYEIQAMEEISEGVTSGRSYQNIPPFNTSGNYTTTTNAIVAMITEGDAYLAGQGIIPPPSPEPGSIATVLVANLADLTAYPITGLKQNQNARVNSLRGTQWFLDLNNTTPVDGITIIATAAGGNTRWVRGATDVGYYFTVSNWFFDAVNGNDEHNGETSGTALKTYAELRRRLSPSFGLVNAAIVLGPPNHKDVSINTLSTMPASDPFNLEIQLPRGSRLVYNSSVDPTIPALGPFNVDAVTPSDPNSGGGGNGWEVTSNGIGAWHIGQRCRIVGGPNDGTIFYPGFDFGADKAQVTNPVIPITFDVLPAQSNIQVGDQFVVEFQCEVSWGNVDIRCEPYSVDTPPALTTPKLLVFNTQFRAGGLNPRNAMTLVSGGNITTIWQGNIFKGLVVDTPKGQFDADIFQAPSGHYMGGNCFNNGAFGGTNAEFTGRLLMGSNLCLNKSILVKPTAHVDFDQDFYSEGGSQTYAMPGIVVQGGATFGRIGVFRSPDAGIQIGGWGKASQATGVLFGYTAFVPCEVYGKDNLLGIAVQPSCTLGYSDAAGPPTITITGTSGDGSLGYDPATGNRATTASQWEPASNTYFFPDVAFSWANLLTAVNLHNLNSDAHATNMGAFL